MITQYFDLNQRLIIQAPGTLAPAISTPWVYGDNYNLAIYLTAGGVIQPINTNDALSLMLFQLGPSLPETNLAIIGSASILTDAAGFQYYLINVNLKTTGLATLVQSTNKPASCEFHYTFNPADKERFSSSADLPITVNPDPTESATGATPVPPAYPTDPSTFERIGNKGVANGYAGLDANGRVPVSELPVSTAGGDMLKSVYDTNNNGVVDTCDSIVSSKVTGLGTAASQNVPVSGNATATQVVLGNDSRLTDTRAPTPHATTHNGGTDAIPLVTSSAQGLCPPVDGTTIQVVSGKLIATTTGNGDMLRSVFVTGSPSNTNAVDNALALQTHQIPATGDASGTQIVLASDSRMINARTPTAHQATHMPGGSDPLGLATTTGAGLCPPPDGTTILISGGKLVSGVTGVGQHGVRRYNSTTITYPTAGIAQALTFDTQVFDTDAYYQAGQFKVPSGQAGYYEMGANVLALYVSGQFYIALALRLNGVANQYLVFSQTPAVLNSQNTYVAVSTIAHLNVGDYIETIVVQGGAVSNLPFGFSGCVPSTWLMRIS